MTNEKLGALLVDVPEPGMFKYFYVADWTCSRSGSRSELRFNIQSADVKTVVKNEAYKCTQEEAKKYPQFRWVALEELE
ncbi:hypothetical protein [Streptococcus suis]